MRKARARLTITAGIRCGELLVKRALRRPGRLLQPLRLLFALLRLLFLRLLDGEPRFHAGQRREEERRLLRFLRRLLGLVALLDDLEVEEGLPSRAREERERDQVAVELRGHEEGVCGFLLASESER